MRTIGQIVKNARTGKRLSLKDLEGKTKIKAAFVQSIEKENWQDLPPFPTVLGFVKSLSGELGIDEKMAVAVLKRDYPLKNLNINPKETKKVFTWSPKLTFTVGVGAIVLAVLGYLAFQYIRFVSPPTLVIESPVEGQVINGNSVLVFGQTDPDAKVIVDNEPVLTDEDGKFSVNIDITPTTKEISIEATSRSGKERIINRTINIQSD